MEEKSKKGNQEYFEEMEEAGAKSKRFTPIFKRENNGGKNNADQQTSKLFSAKAVILFYSGQ